MLWILSVILSKLGSNVRYTLQFYLLFIIFLLLLNSILNINHMLLYIYLEYEKRSFCFVSPPYILVQFNYQKINNLLSQN